MVQVHNHTLICPAQTLFNLMSGQVFGILPNLMGGVERRFLNLTNTYKPASVLAEAGFVVSPHLIITHNYNQTI